MSKDAQFKFYRVIPVADFPAGERLFVEIGNQPIVIFNLGDSFYAIADICSHDDGQLGDGELEGFEIICPRHGARFDIRTGKALSAPAFVDIPVYSVRIREGWLEVGLSGTD
ncbi:MAG: non-heme iron oxygenase ferredoxin subunit [Anaerolineae bacterium]|nr:non-heme iron oxygenase ferredoxin subunit [Anaerolineae bacterium]